MKCKSTPGLHRQARRGRPERRRAGRKLFCLAMQTRPPPRPTNTRAAAGGKQFPSALAGPVGLPPTRLSKAGDVGLSAKAARSAIRSRAAGSVGFALLDGARP
jgi:hypothetical protein